MTLVPNFIIYIYNGETYDRETLENLIYEEEINKKIIKTGMTREDFLNDKKLSSMLIDKVRERVENTSYDEFSDSASEGFIYEENFGFYIRSVKFPEKTQPVLISDVKKSLLTSMIAKPILELVPESPKESIPVPGVKNSYENCYGFINHEAEDFIGQLFQSKGTGKSTLAERLELDKTFTVERCRQLLSTIDVETYSTSQRRRFMALNYRLSHLGIAPRWRGVKRDRHYKSSDRERSPEQDAYLRDIQVFDMEWVYKKYHGHMVDITWDGIMVGIFTSETFNTKKAAIIAEMPFTLPQKAEYLMLTMDMQKELSMLRCKKTDDFIRSLVDQSMRMGNDLMNAAKRNKRRGTKLEENLQVRKDLWLAAQLIPGSNIPTIIDTYQSMTGVVIKKSNCKRIIDSMNFALNEIGSKYVLN